MEGMRHGLGGWGMGGVKERVRRGWGESKSGAWMRECGQAFTAEDVSRCAVAHSDRTTVNFTAGVQTSYDVKKMLMAMQST